MRGITQRNGACPAVAASNPCKAAEPPEAREPVLAITSLRPVFGSAKSDISIAAAFLLLFVSAFLFGAQGQAFAAWPIAEHEQVSLGYLDGYASSSGEAFKHHGVDIPADAGALVRAPVAGEVSFVGSIPAEESSGHATTLGVSIRMGDGRVVTLLPFDEVDVEEGAVVREGDALGALAASGDKSSPATHLHMGLKRGRTYYDPMELLGGSKPAEKVEIESAPVAVTPLSQPALTQAEPAAASATARPAAEKALPVESPSINSPISADALEGYRESLEAECSETSFLSFARGEIKAFFERLWRSGAALLASISGGIIAASLAGAALLAVGVRSLTRRARVRASSESSRLEGRSPARQKRYLAIRAARLLGRTRSLAN